MNYNIEPIETLRCTLRKELDEYSMKKEITSQTLAHIQSLTDSISRIDKIIAKEENEMGSSRMGNWQANGSYYDDDDSYYSERGSRRRNSRDNGMSMRGRDDGDWRRMGGGHSRDGGNDIAEQLRDMMNDATEKEREAIRRCLKDIE